MNTDPQRPPSDDEQPEPFIIDNGNEDIVYE